MKYKAGDRVKIREDIGAYTNLENMIVWAGKAMTIRKADAISQYYRMIEDGGVLSWLDHEIEGLADEPPKQTYTEVLQLAVDTYGVDEQCRMINEEMAELTVALSKHHRNPDADTLKAVIEEIADVKIMADQAAMMFGEIEVEQNVSDKVQRLHERLKDEQEIEIVEGKHKINGKTYAWQNPDKVKCEVGEIVIADTEKGHAAVIVTNKQTEKAKYAKLHRKIICRGSNWEDESKERESKMNNVTLTGRMTCDPEVRYTSGSQMAVARFSIAIDRPVKSGGEKQTDFPNIVVFGKQAENCERFLGKGRMVGIQGRIQTGSYTNKDGVKVYTTEVVANNVEFLDFGKDNEKLHEQKCREATANVPDRFQMTEDDGIPF